MGRSAGQLPTGTVTFLISDVEGSTRLLRELGAERYAGALADHRQVIRHACRRHAGVEVDTQGDAFFFAFPAAADALAAAAALTEALGVGPISVRVGLHTGTPLLTEEGYVGDDVHLAARIAASAHGGQVVCSAATARLVELPLTDLGEHRLKDMEEPVGILQLGGGAFPPLKTISNTNLPRPASRFLGRRAEVEQLLERITAGARLVTLTGPGGAGKTRLAIEAASALVGKYRAGVFWAELAPLREPALVMQTMARTLGSRDGLAEHIGERETLLVLDNLEQVIGAAPELAELVERCPNLTILVTSRELMRVRGEVEFALPPLAKPEAVELFSDRSGMRATAAIAELCARLDNLPLAVELAAARARSLAPEHILARLGQRLDLLSGGRDADPRQKTLRATIEWSHDLLASDERTLFAGLSVFAGGCTLEAAEAVVGANPDGLQSLVEKSLLGFDGERYWMLETIREYAAQQFEERTDREPVRGRHFGFYLGLAEDLSVDVWDAGHDSAMARYGRELDNMRGALAWARARDDGSSLIRLVVAMADFWHASDHLREGHGWLEEALARVPTQPTPTRVKALLHAAGMAHLLGDPAHAHDRATQALTDSRALGDAGGAGHALLRVGNALHAQGEREGLADVYSVALGLARQSGDVRLTAVALTNVGECALEEERLDDAEAAFRESNRLFESLANKRGRAASLRALGEIAIHAGRLEEAAEALARCGRLYLDHGTKVWTAPYLETTAALLSRRAEPERALRLLGSARRLREETGTTHSSAGTSSPTEDLVTQLGEEAASVALDEGRSLAAEEAIEEALNWLAAAASTQ